MNNHKTKHIYIYIYNNEKNNKNNKDLGASYPHLALHGRLEQPQLNRGSCILARCCVNLPMKCMFVHDSRLPQQLMLLPFMCSHVRLSSAGGVSLNCGFITFLFMKISHLLVERYRRGRADSQSCRRWHLRCF